MAISLTSFLVPKNSGAFYLVEDSYMKGGFRIVDSISSRDAIFPLCRKAGMHVHVTENSVTYILQADLSTWVELSYQDSDGQMDGGEF